MSRKPSSLGDYLRRQRTRAEPEASAPPAIPEPKKSRHKKPKVAQTLYLDEAVHKALMGIVAVKYGETSPYTGRKLRLHDLLLAGVDEILAKHGEKSIAEFNRGDEEAE